jgi:hypothetical protein
MELEQPKKVKKTENINAYMNEYMKNKYKEDPVKSKKYKNSLYIKKKYNIKEEAWNKYKENLHHIYHIKKMVDELPTGMFECFLMEYKNIKLTNEDI